MFAPVSSSTSPSPSLPRSLCSCSSIYLEGSLHKCIPSWLSHFLPIFANFPEKSFLVMASKPVPHPLSRETEMNKLREILLLELNCVIVKASKFAHFLPTSYSPRIPGTITNITRSPGILQGRIPSSYRKQMPLSCALFGGVDDAHPHLCGQCPFSAYKLRLPSLLDSPR